MHEVFIYGEIVPFSEKWITDQGGYVNIDELQRQLKEAKGKDIKVRIRSFGGDVETGFTMYNELRRYAKENSAKVTTLGEGQVASIATVIFLAGDERILTGHTEPFVHNAWVYSEGDSKTLVRVAAELEKCNNMIADHYALHTDLTREDALALMDADTSITPEEAVKIRFATSIEEVLRPAALKRFSTNTNDKKMNKKTNSVLRNAKRAAKAVLGIKNKIVKTADQTDLDFPDVADDGIIAVGDYAEYDGEDANGRYVLADGETYVFDGDGILLEIVPASSEDPMTDPNAEATILALTEQLEVMTNAVITLQAENAKKDALILGYKASSKPAPQRPQEVPKPNAPAANASEALDEKIKKTANIKLK